MKSIQVVGALLALGLVGVIVFDLVSPEQGAEQTLVVKVDGDQKLEEGRFNYSAKISVGVSPRQQGAKGCVVVLGRQGQILGKPWELVPGTGGWSMEASASKLSASHYGPLWLVALEGPGDCRQASDFVKDIEGRDQPTQAVGALVAAHPQWRWGAARVYIHDKLP